MEDAGGQRIRSWEDISLEAFQLQDVTMLEQ